MTEEPHLADAHLSDDLLPSPTDHIVSGDPIGQRLHAAEIADQILARDPDNELAKMMREIVKDDIDRLMPPPSS